jgi:P27 family predicted phage terminase small subunit
MRGRKPTPVEQREREGNPGKRRMPKAVVLAPGELVKPELPGEASELWDELVPVLTEANVLHRIDSAALEALCIQWHRSVQAREVLSREGLFSLGSMGQTVEHPALAVERSAHTLFVRFAEQYGITPVARARIAAVAAGVREASMAEELAQLGIEA